MHITTRRTLVAVAVLTAAVLYGSLPFHGSTQALDDLGNLGVSAGQIGDPSGNDRGDVGMGALIP
jgi:hypothetical protein